MNLRVITIAMLVGIGIFVSNLRTAHGELVFEDDLKDNLKGNTLSTNMNTANNENSSNHEKNDLSKSDDPSKSEMLRRQRLREELKNEDLLTQKLEELRLKDEQHRTEQLVGKLSGVDKVDKAEDESLPLTEERVGSATASAPTAVATTTLVATSAAPAAAAPIVTPTHSEFEDNRKVSISPRGGISSIMNSIYDVDSRYSVGLGITADVTEYIAVTGGYTFSKYSLGAGNTLAYPVGLNPALFQRIELNDNVIDLGVRGYFLETRSKVRPFIGGGAAYRRGFVNYDDQTRRYMQNITAYNGQQNVRISGLAGYLETGAEIRLAKAISVAGVFRYFNILNSHQTRAVNPYAFLGSNGYSNYYNTSYPNYYGYTNDTREQAGSALAKNNFYQLMVGVSVSW